MNHLSPELRLKIKEKLSSLQKIADDIPGVIIIHRIPEFTVEYMSERGLNYFGVTNDDLIAMGTDYYPRYFNEEDAADYVPKIAAMIEQNNMDNLASFFQQVRNGTGAPWTWHFSTTKIFMQNDEGKPLLSITISLPVDPEQHVSSKLERLLEEYIFLRKNKSLFLSLTNREREILRLLALSQSAAEIAARLIISVHTVETHRKNLRKKLSITTTYELNKFASAFDLI